MMSGHRPPRFGVQQTFGWFRPADLYLNAIRRMPGYVCVGCGTYVKAVVRAGGVSTRCVPCRIDLRAEREALSRWWIDDPLVACECGRWFAPATRKRNAAMAGAIIHCPECDLLEPTPILIPQPVMWDLTEDFIDLEAVRGLSGVPIDPMTGREKSEADKRRTKEAQLWKTINSMPD